MRGWRRRKEGEAAKYLVDVLAEAIVEEGIGEEDGGARGIGHCGHGQARGEQRPRLRAWRACRVLGVNLLFFPLASSLPSLSQSKDELPTLSSIQYIYQFQFQSMYTLNSVVSHLWQPKCT